MTIGDFLQAQLSASGPWNCSTLVADWLIASGYPDYAKDFRHLTDPAECRAVAQEWGGLAYLWEAYLCGAAPWPDGPFEPGDIAVVQLADHEAGAIFTGERWAMRQDRGLVFASPDILTVARAWRP